MAVGALPDGTPVIAMCSGHHPDYAVRVWQLADGTAVADPIPDRGVRALAVGTLDGASVIVSGSADGMVRVRRLADGASLVPPLDLSEWVYDVAVHGEAIITAAGTDIAVHRRTPM